MARIGDLIALDDVPEVMTFEKNGVSAHRDKRIIHNAAVPGVFQMNGLAAIRSFFRGKHGAGPFEAETVHVVAAVNGFGERES